MRSTAPAAICTAALLLSTAAAAAEDIRPYIRAGVGAAMSGDTAFADDDCTSRHPAALFGCGNGDDGKPLGAYGDFGSSAMFELAAGAELTDYFRIEAAFDYQPGFEFDGNANFRDSGKEQPVAGKVTQMGAMLFGYLEPLAAIGTDTRLKPFFGLGAGLSRNEIGEMTYDFPAFIQPAYSVTPGGTVTDFSWAVSAGLSYEVSDRLVLDLAWRYSDFGTVETDQGLLFIQRSKKSFDVEIGETRARLTSHAVSLSARLRF